MAVRLNAVPFRLDILLQPLINRAQEDKHSRLVRHVLALFPTTPLAELGHILGCSQRTIERSFLKVTGITLKQYYSMQRLEDMLDYVTQHMKKNVSSNSINWVDVALKFNFSDQPHLIRYLKSTIGATPGKYVNDRDLAIDVYGNFE
jgi:transcriptional regulator GlxA family with amidase domain